MGDIASTQTGLMCLPRELRDEIYTHLFPSASWVDISPSFRLSNSSDDTQVVTLTGPDPGQKVTLSTWFTLEKPFDRIAMLQVNKTISEEVKQVLYKSSAFLFNIGSLIAPSTMEFGNIEALKRMQNIEVNLDLKAAFYYRTQVSDQEAALASAEKLLSLLADGSFPRDQCIIKIDYFRDYHLLMGELPTVIRQLAAFRMVELQIRHRYTCYRRPGFSNFVDMMDGQRQQIFMHMDRTLSGGLGSGAMGYDQDGVYCMRYHPRGSFDQRRSQKAMDPVEGKLYTSLLQACSGLAGNLIKGRHANH